MCIYTYVCPPPYRLLCLCWPNHARMLLHVLMVDMQCLAGGRAGGGFRQDRDLPVLRYRRPESTAISPAP